MLRQELLQLSEKNEGPCISIIVPTHRVQPVNQQDPIMVKNAIREAKKLLREKYGKEYANLEDKLDKLQQQIDFSNTLNGLTIFISPSITKMIYLPFDVKEKVIVDQSFQVRDLIFAANRMIDYYVLSLAEKSTRLFSGIGQSLMEIKNKDFPLAYFPDKQKPDPISPWGVDLSQLSSRYKKAFIRQVDEATGKILMGNSNPLFLVGDDKLHGYFRELSDYTGRIEGYIHGNYDEHSLLDLLDVVYPNVEEYMERERNKVFSDINEAINKHQFTSGLTNVWKAAYEGNCDNLVVETNFHRPGYVTDDDGYNLHLQKPNGNSAKKLEDAVDDVIELVRDRGGEITFVENDALDDHQKIGLILRYAR